MANRPARNPPSPPEFWGSGAGHFRGRVPCNRGDFGARGRGVGAGGLSRFVFGRGYDGRADGLSHG